MLDHAMSEVVMGSKRGIDVLTKIPGEGSKRTSPPLIKMDETVKAGKLFNAGYISIEKHALSGITFYEIYRQGDEGRLRAHFIKSIYGLAWRNFA